MQHGVSSGYYLAFLSGGFAQTSGRLCRTYLRPLVLPADYVSARGVPPPPQTTVKRLYDLVGFLTALPLMNYLAVPFMLLTWRECLRGWRAVGWYGHILIFVPFVFFHLGGAKLLRNLQVTRVKRVSGKVDADKLNGSPGTSTPGTPAMQVPALDMAAK